MQPDRERGWWKVSTRQWVGAFSLGELRVIVRPKIKLENLFLLLEVGLPPGGVAGRGHRLRQQRRAAARAGVVLRSHGRDHAGTWSVPPLPARGRRPARAAGAHRLRAAVPAGWGAGADGVLVGRLHRRCRREPLPDGCDSAGAACARRALTTTGDGCDGCSQRSTAWPSPRCR